MHEAVAAQSAQRTLAGADLRVALRRFSVAADLVAVLVATSAATYAWRLAAPLLGLDAAGPALSWLLAVPVVAVLVVYYGFGLYDQTAYMSRPLHAWTIARACAVSFVAAVLVEFVAGPGFNVSRLVTVLSFAMFCAFDIALRVGILDRFYVSRIKRLRPAAFVVGGSRDSNGIVARLSDLRGYATVRRIQLGGSMAADSALGRALNHRPAGSLPADVVFADGRSLSPREVTDVVEAAQARGADVYVISRLLRPLEGNGLPTALFQAPVMRVRRGAAPSSGYRFKRALDVVGAAVALLLLSPVIALIAILIKATSPGPVLHKHTRVGRGGRTFDFLKFRSMEVDGDPTAHEEYVRDLINGGAQPMATDAEGNGVYKMLDDPRITSIGRFIRKYSLDEIPQFWNVIRGDMSLVGPRPPMPNEAHEYDEWQMRRLDAEAGLTGPWQVNGRNKVSYDEMTLQDLMYARNMGLWVDICLCLRTVPAALLGGGG